MAETRATLKGHFVAGAEPTETQFAALIDGLVSTKDDSTMEGNLIVSSETLFARGYAATKPSILTKWPAHTDATAGNATITIAQVLTGILEADPGADITYTLPTAALAVAGVVGVAVGDCIDFSVINTGSAGEDEIITVAIGSGGTLIGYSGVGTPTPTHDAVEIGSGLFRLRFTNVTASSEAYTVYRIA